MPDDNKPLALGFHDVALECPDCGEAVVVSVEFVTVRQSATDEGVTLRFKAKHKKTKHTCGQPRLAGIA